MISNAWQVFMLFAIPIGGGIPAGVLLAQSKGISWVMMTILYFISDVALAFCFEPLMMLVIYAGKRSSRLGRVNEVFKKAMDQTVSRYGVGHGPFMLVMIAFGVDPMTGRAVAKAAGHSFISGWMIAIMGDMIFFGVVMISTLWLNQFLGDGTWTAIIIMVAMMVIPALIRRAKKLLTERKSQDAHKNDHECG